MKKIHELQLLVCEDLKKFKRRVFKIGKSLKYIDLIVKKNNPTKKEVRAENFFKAWRYHHDLFMAYALDIIKLNDETGALKRTKIFLLEYNKFKQSKDYTDFIQFLRSESKSGDEDAKRADKIFKRLDFVYSQLLTDLNS